MGAKVKDHIVAHLGGMGQSLGHGGDAGQVLQHDLVGMGEIHHLVTPRSAGEDEAVAAGPAKQPVIAVPPRKSVAPGAAHQRVSPVGAGQDIGKRVADAAKIAGAGMGEVFDMGILGGIAGQERQQAQGGRDGVGAAKGKFLDHVVGAADVV